ncbi:hypothetical protein VSAK1_26645 [Vibrio mediterranei AK1]|uniref:hypothetical protein n=1 Tax=Vibrio mediterranei TaxID=689 RepID=UPI0001542B7C|nr:hypothetical protein [Vibrio mediterranei]EDL52207.1 hypothetical protein VSAK1_26645 [Vibrio mediterranei AK1]
MKDFLKYTFGGLKTSYLIRQYIFGMLISFFYFNVATTNGQSLSAAIIAFFVINALLYPYSRFVYESIVEFVIGDNVFYVNGILMLFIKAITMILCWVAAILIAPIGLIYIYYHHTRA